MSPWVQYLIFLLKSVTTSVVILFVVAGFFTLLRKAKEHPKQKLNIRPLNKTYDAFSEVLNKELMNQAEYKKYRKSEKNVGKKRLANQQNDCLSLIFKGIYVVLLSTIYAKSSPPSSKWHSHKTKS